MSEQEAKTHLTAVVLIPPEEVWEPIQAIRRLYDPQIRRWMPHITLLYPFVPEAAFDDAASLLKKACSRVAPMSIALRKFRFFSHGARSATLWLAPEPPEAIQRLQAKLLRAFPYCDDTSHHEKGFTPHLSVGKVKGRAAAEETVRRLQSTWQPLSWRAHRVQLIARSGRPGDPFHVRRRITLG